MLELIEATENHVAQNRTSQGLSCLLHRPKSSEFYQKDEALVRTEPALK